MGWKLSILGGASLVNSSGEPVRLRSRSTLAMLVYLALQGRSVSRLAVEDLLWPDSDPERRSQNYRKALSDLRDSFEADDSRGAVLYSSRESLGLIEGAVCTDALDFGRLARDGLSRSDEGLLSEAVNLYQGNLWPECPGEWIIGHREELEELFAQSICTLGNVLLKAGRTQDAVRLGRQGVLKAPHREDVHASLIRAYALSGQSVEAIRQFEALERMLDDNWGEAPSARSHAALDSPCIESVPSLGGAVTATGGALSPISNLYVERGTDAQARKAIESRESVILVFGPRQVGKTSLVAQSLVGARNLDYAVALSDMQSLGTSQISDCERFYQTLADHLVRGLGIDMDLPKVWNSWLGPNSNLDNIVRSVLGQVDRPVLWAMDEVDRLFGKEFSSDFFGLVRSWHNRRALDPEGPWSRLSMIITYATEAHLFIDDLNQSPFNVGVRLKLDDFDLACVQELNLRMGSPATQSEVESIYKLTHGQPFLSRRALDFMARGGRIEDLHELAHAADGPFGEHLRRLGDVVSRDDEIKTAVRRMLTGESIGDAKIRSRLISGGVARHTGNETAFRVPIYSTFLQSFFMS